VAVGALYEAALVKLLAEINIPALMALCLRVLLPKVPNLSFSFVDPPLLNPARDKNFVSVNLKTIKLARIIYLLFVLLHVEFFLHVHLVHLN